MTRLYGARYGALRQAMDTHASELFRLHPGDAGLHVYANWSAPRKIMPCSRKSPASAASCFGMRGLSSYARTACRLLRLLASRHIQHRRRGCPDGAGMAGHAKHKTGMMEKRSILNEMRGYDEMLNASPSSFIIMPALAKIVCEPGWKWQNAKGPCRTTICSMYGAAKARSSLMTSPLPWERKSLPVPSRRSYERDAQSAEAARIDIYPF